jgi:prefoldin subunit 5
MRYVLVLLSGLGLMAGAAANSPSREQMKQIYAANQRLKVQAEQLDMQLAQIERQIEHTKKAIANLQYVEAENEK